MKNLDIYEAVRSVPKEAQKTIGAGRLKNFTDINPMWRIKKLTELFGPCGLGWWYTIDRQWIEYAPNGEYKAFCNISLYYADLDSGSVSQAVQGTGGSAFIANEKSGPYVSDECYKMALTDALSVAAKALGIGADIYWAADSTKYTAKKTESAAKAVKPVKKEPEKADLSPKFPKGGFMTADKLKELTELAGALNYGPKKLILATQKKYGKLPTELTEEEYNEIVATMAEKISEGKADEPEKADK
jgi:hypothetical protein